MSRRTGRRGWLLVALLVAAAPLLGGCGENTGTGGDPTGPTPSAYPSDLPCGAPAVGELLIDYRGLTEQQAGDLAAEQGLKVRVVGRDGECYAVDMSYSKSRVNLYLEDGLVVWAAIF